MKLTRRGEAVVLSLITGLVLWLVLVPPFWWMGGR